MTLHLGHTELVEVWPIIKNILIKRHLFMNIQKLLEDSTILKVKFEKH